MKENILLIEDEEALQMALSDRLRREGYVVDSAADGETGFEKATTLPFDLILLDIMLPGRNGLDLCRDIRVAGLGTPILLLTARIEALLRRAPIRTGQAVYQFGSIRIETRAAMDHRDVKVTRNGEAVYLSVREFELLRYFVEHAGIVLPREKLLREVWGYEVGTFTR